MQVSAWAGRKVLVALLMVLTLLPVLPARAGSATEIATYSSDLSDMLLILAGTATIFDSPRLQAALQDPEPLLVTGGKTLDPQKVQALLHAAGFHEWTERPRLWIVEPVGEAGLTILSADTRLTGEARYRALPLSGDSALPQDVATVRSLVAKPDPATLQTLLAGHKADAMVVVQTTPAGYAWTLLGGKRMLTGKLPADADVSALLPHLLCELLAAPAEWPEAGGRTLVRVGGIANYRDFAAVQAALLQLPGLQGLSLVRLDTTSAWFALKAPLGEALKAALDADTRLPADTPPATLRPLAAQALRQAAQVQSRLWAAPVADSRAAPAQ